jgi:hypothetical protein
MLHFIINMYSSFSNLQRVPQDVPQYTHKKRQTRKISKGNDIYGLEVYRPFGGTYCLQLTRKEQAKQATKKESFLRKT